MQCFFNDLWKFLFQFLIKPFSKNAMSLERQEFPALNPRLNLCLNLSNRKTCIAGQFIGLDKADEIFFEDITIENNVDNNETTTSSSVDGDYENFALGFSLGVTYKF